MISYRTLPLLAAVLLAAGGGLFLLEKAQRQARDTTRKHHLEDIEQSLYFARQQHGTYPPYEASSWCGFINAEENRSVRDQMEVALRAQHEQYKNAAKPYPTDPDPAQDYFYWKRSPSSFELYSVLEYGKTGERNSFGCDNSQPQKFDYGISSILRERGSRITEGPL